MFYNSEAGNDKEIGEILCVFLYVYITLYTHIHTERGKTHRQKVFTYSKYMNIKQISKMCYGYNVDPNYTGESCTWTERIPKLQRIEMQTKSEIH